MKILTVATDLDNFFLKNLLIPSCQHFDLELVILNPLTSWNGHRMKDKFLISYLRDLDANDIILFTDAYDTMILNDGKSIIDTFNRFGTPLLFSSEITCWPEEKLAYIYQILNPLNRFRFLNSGGFIGRVKNILEILENNVDPPSEILNTQFEIGEKDVEAYDKKYQWSNQYYWTMAYFSKPETISLDVNLELFITIGGPTNYNLNDYKEYSELGVNSRVYEEEFTRIQNILNELRTSDVSHIHFNNPLSKEIFLEVLNKNRLPNWINGIISKKDGRKVEIVEL